MKIKNSVVVLMILVFGSQLSHGANLDCEFRDWDFSSVGWLYSCYVRSIVNPHNNVTIDGYSGKHWANKNDTDVKGISIYGINTKYIPTNIGSLFNLTALYMWNTNLVEIRAKDFHGMQDLEEIRLIKCKLSSVPFDVFATLTKLRYISFGWNSIEELPNNIFVNCLELEEIYLTSNRIKYIGTEIFDNLKKLNLVDLFNNICVSHYYVGATQIIQLKDDIKIRCKKPNEVRATTTLTTTQNPTTTSTTQAPTTTSTTQAPTTTSTTKTPSITTTTQNPTTTSTTQAPTTTSTTKTPSITTTLTTQTPMNADVIEFKKSLSNFFDNLFTELREANEKLKNQTML